MPELLTFLPLIAIFLFTGWHCFQYFKRRSGRRGRKFEPAWDREGEVRRLIGSTEALRALYTKLGYSPDLVFSSEQLIRDLKGLIRAEIPDFPEFQKTLEETRGQVEKQRSEGIRDPSSSGDEGLLKEVLSAGSDRDRVLALLNRAPVDESLLFVEQLPFSKDGQLIWRTPVDLSILRKRPSDPARFVGLLQQLEDLVKSPGVPRDERLGREMGDVITRLRRDLQRENAYFPTALRSLEKKGAEWASHLPGVPAREMKAQLDGLLGDLLSTRHEYGPDEHPGRAIQGSKAVLFKETAQRQAKCYLDAPWMHTPWLTAYVLTNLIDSELVSLPAKPHRKPPSPADVLRVIRDEVVTAQYDSDENIRRLQQQEERGLFIHSLVYALFRLNRSSSMTAPPKA